METKVTAMKLQGFNLKLGNKRGILGTGFRWWD